MAMDRSSSRSGGFAMKIKPLNFQFISDDGREVTYRAVINDSALPLEPVFALTVITGSPRDPQEQTDLQGFLKQVTAAFSLVGPAKGQKPAPDHRPIPFRPEEDVLFIAELVTVKAAGSFEVELEVESSIVGSANSASGLLPSIARFVNRWKKRHVNTRKHIYQAAGGTPVSAKVTCSRGAVKVSPAPVGDPDPVHINAVAPKETQTPTTEYITVRPDFNGRSTFTIHASFHKVA